MLSGTPAQTIRAVIDELRSRGVVRRKGRPGTYLLTQLGRAVMRRERVIPLRLPVEDRPPPRDDDLQYDEGLFEALKERRLEVAVRDQVPAYVVAHDATLRQMAAVRPTTPEQLLEVKGMGPAKVERFGDELLEVVVKHGSG
jgi:ATP-dependent DNA helicase RecQ